MDLREVLDAFANPHTENLHDRQSSVLRRLLRECTEGFLFRQLPEVCELLELIWARIANGASQFVPQLQEVIKLCGLPVIRERSNEEFLGGLVQLERLVGTLERFLHVPLPEVQISTCEALREVALGRDILRTNTPPTVRVLGASAPVKEDLRPLPRDLHQGLLLKTGVVAGLAAEIQHQVGLLAGAMHELDARRGGGNMVEAGTIRTVLHGYNDDDDSEDEEKEEEGYHQGQVGLEKSHDDDSVNGEEEAGDGGGCGRGDGGAGPGGGSRGGGGLQVAVKTHTLKAELVSSMPGDMRALLNSLMGLMREISGNALSTAEIVKAGGTGVVVGLLRLLVPEPRDPLINACVEVLWNCLEHSQTMLELGPPAASRTQLVERRRNANAMFSLSTEETLGTLRDLLGALLDTGHRARDKELRNEVLIVASFIARQRRSHSLFRTTGLLDMLLLYATAAETSEGVGLVAQSERIAAKEASASEAAAAARGNTPPTSRGGQRKRRERQQSFLGMDDDDDAGGGGGGMEGGGTAAAAAAEGRDGGGLPPLQQHGGGGGEAVDLHNFATAQAADLELKRILWALLSDLSRNDPLNLKAVVNSSLLGVLLMYLNVDLNLSPDTAFATVAALAQRGNGNGGDGYGDDLKSFDSAHSGTNGGSTRPHRQGGGGGGGLSSSVTPHVIKRLPRTQLRVLQLQSMSVLLNLAPRAPEKFKALAGHIITLRFLDACSESSESLRGLVQGALMLLLSFVGLPGLQEELGQLDAVRIMLARFNDVGAPASLRADAVCILSRLCAGHEVNQATFRQDGGIVSLIHQLEAYARARQPAPREKRGALPPGAFGMSGSATEKVSPLVVGVVDCLWNGVVGNKRSEARLLSVGGMDALLNMLEVCPILMRHQIAGLVADLCENASIVPYVKAWKSDRTMVGAVELLMHVFEDEEVRLRFDRPDSTITNLWEPLRQHAAEQVTTLDSSSEEGADGGGGGATGDGGSGVGSGGMGSVGGRGGGGTGGGEGGGGASGGGDSSGGGGGGGSGGGPKRFARLQSALQQSSSHKAEQALRRAIEVQDLRAKITAIVARIGFEYAGEGLGAPDRATLLMAEHYVEFRAGETWLQVRRELLVEGTKPIAADAYLLESKLEGVFNSAREVKCAQMGLSQESRGEAQGKEQAFFDTVLQQRDQEIRVEQIRRSAKQPKSKQKRQAEAQERERLLAEATAAAVPEGDEATGEGAEGAGEEGYSDPLGSHVSMSVSVVPEAGPAMSDPVA
jgi:hypothetical protein